MTAMMKATVFVAPGRIELVDKPIPAIAMLSTLAYSPCEPYGKRVKWRSLSH